VGTVFLVQAGHTVVCAGALSLCYLPETYNGNQWFARVCCTCSCGAHWWSMGSTLKLLWCTMQIVGGMLTDDVWTNLARGTASQAPPGVDPSFCRLYLTQYAVREAAHTPITCFKITPWASALPPGDWAHLEPSHKTVIVNIGLRQVMWPMAIRLPRSLKHLTHVAGAACRRTNPDHQVQPHSWD
jgi:hypothetical protein